MNSATEQKSMDENYKSSKIMRVLRIYQKLMNGYTISKSEEATLYQVDGRTIQRDIEDIRLFLTSYGDMNGNKLVYDRRKKGYIIKKPSKQLIKADTFRDKVVLELVKHT